MRRNGSGDDSTSTLWNPELDWMFDLLRNRHRRVILLLLLDRTVLETADVIVRGERGTEEGEEIGLTHVHLPKLAAAGCIEWDEESGEIRPGPRFDEIAPLLELIETHADDLPPGWP